MSGAGGNGTLGAVARRGLESAGVKSEHPLV